MRVPFGRRVAPRLLVCSVLGVALGLLAVRGGDVRAASPPNPAQFDATTGISVSSQALGVSADLTFTRSVAGGDLDSGGLAIGVPPQADVHDQIMPGSGPALGDVVGTVSWDMQLGLTNMNCAPPAQTATFVLMNAVPDDAGAVPLVTPDDTPPAAGQGRMQPYLRDDGSGVDGTPAAQTTMGDGLPAGVEGYPSFLDDVFDDNGTPVRPYARYFGGTVVAGTAMTLNLMIFNPGNLSVFDAPNPLYDLRDQRMGYEMIPILNDPSAAAAPGQITDNCSPTTETMVLFGNTKPNSCQPAGACAAGGSITEPCSVNTDVVPPILARCDSLASTGRVCYENPGTAESGTCVTRCVRLFTAVEYSRRDVDGDGLENAFDTCPYTATTTAFDPRTGANDPDDDPDADAIPGGGPAGGCDPTAGVNTGAGNHDSDAYPANGDPWRNAGDNCPLVGNGDQAESELTQPDNIARPRGGTHSDGIGDACDGPEIGGQCGNGADDDVDGLVNDGCPTVGSFAEVGCLNTVDEPDEDPAPGIQNDDSVVNDGCPSSALVANGAYYATFSLMPVCFSNTPATDDTDGDGYCDTVTAIDAPNGYDIALPADPNDTNAGRTPESYALYFPLPVMDSGASGSSPPARQPVQACNDGIDNDGNGLVDLLDTASGKCRPPQPLVYATTDTDGDGYRDEDEIHIGTDPLGRCEVGGPASSTDWPADLVSSGPFSRDRTDISDLASYVAPVYILGTNPTDPDFNRRWDLRPGPGVLTTWITVGDLSNLTLSQPPMFGVFPNQVNAFNGPVCTAGPVLGD